MKKQRLNTKDVIFIGMLAAICAIATTLKVPLPTGAMVHLGTAAIFIIGIAFGGVYAGLAGAIGSAFFDLLMGFSPYTLWSFGIKGVAGFIVGSVAKGVWPEPSYYSSGRGWLKKAVLGCILAAVWTLGGYILAWWQVLGSLAVALANIPASLLTSGIGMIVALVLSPKIRKLANR